MLLRLFILILSLAPALALASDIDRLQVSDLLDYERVGDAQISPDGTEIVYTRQWVNQQTDRWESSLWLMDADGSRQRFLMQGSQPRWSPSGDRLLFVNTGDNGKPQLFVRWMKGDGAVSQVTRINFSPSSAQWSPDGQSIAFVGIVPGDDSWEIDLPAAPDGASWTQAPKILDQLHYRQDRVGYMEPGYSHLFLVPAESGKARQLTQGKWNVGARRSPAGSFGGAGLSWTPDSQAIVFDGYQTNATDLDYRRSHIYKVSVSDGLIAQLTTTDGYWIEPTVSPDGREIAYLGHPEKSNTYLLPRLHKIGIDGSNARLVTESFDRPLVGVKFWLKNDLYFSAQDEGYIQIFTVGRSGQVNAITSGEHSALLQSVSRDGKHAIGALSRYQQPYDIYKFDLKKSATEPTRLTMVNDDLLAGKTLGEHREIWFEAEDGNRAHGWLITPPNFDPKKKYPLLMEIHGGPFAMYRGQFTFKYQVFAANDYVVLYTNPRGSTGYGEKFSQAIDHAYPSVDYLDLMAGVDAALETGFVDEQRMYVGGCSGGGVLTSWVIGHTTRFAAASVRCPVSNWVSMLGQTDIPNFTLSFFKKPFWEDPTDWLRHSSIMYVGNVTTPTIVMTGEQDLRTPMAQSEEYYAALKIAGVESRLIRFNDQYHGTETHPSNAMRSMLYLLSWYGQFDINGERKIQDESPEE